MEAISVTIYRCTTAVARPVAVRLRGLSRVVVVFVNIWGVPWIFLVIHRGFSKSGGGWCMRMRDQRGGILGRWSYGSLGRLRGEFTCSSKGTRSRFVCNAREYRLG